MTKNYIFNKVLAYTGVLFVVAGFLFAGATMAAAQEATIDSISDGAMPTFAGTATGTDTLDLSVTDDSDSEVYSASDIAVTDEAWSYEATAELPDGDYVAAVSAESTELATSSFAVDTEEDDANDDDDDDDANDDEDDDTDDDDNESISDRLSRMEAFITRLQSLIERLMQLREIRMDRINERAADRAGDGGPRGPLNNPNLQDGPPGLNDKCSDDFPGRGRGVKKGCEGYDDDTNDDDDENDDDASDDDDENDDDSLEIEVEIEDGEATVEIEYGDGTEDEFVVEATDHDEIIDAIVDETDLTREEIENVIEFEEDDSSEDEDEEENREDAQEAIDQANASIDEVDEDMDDADSDVDTSAVTEQLGDALARLAEAESAFENGDYNEAEELAEQAEELAETAADLLEDAEEAA